MRTSPNDLTAEQIATVRTAALAANDLTLVNACDAAASGQFMAKQVVCGAIDKVPGRRMR